MRLFKAAVAACVVLAAFPAQSAVVLTEKNVGYSFSIGYAGQVSGTEVKEVNGLGEFTFDGITDKGRTYNFTYSITNSSSVASRLTSWGFDVTKAEIVSGYSTGTFASANLDNNYPEGIGKVDLCFEADKNGNCTGGSAGLTKGKIGTGTFAMTFADAMDSVTLDGFVARFQSISGVKAGTSGVGFGSLMDSGGGGGGGGETPVSAAPEPTTWGMMLIGFGLIGSALRSRRRHSLRPQIV